jgi:hypothetical protein
VVVEREIIDRNEIEPSSGLGVPVSTTHRCCRLF